jgi:hypothetical protein
MYALTEQEQQWVQSQSDSDQAMLCLQFAAGINHLNYSWIEPLLGDHTTYGSQTIWEELEGDKLREYWEGKLETLRRSGDKIRATIELAHESMHDDPCILIYQRKSDLGNPGLGDMVGYTTIESDGQGQIAKMFAVSAVPAPSSCKRTGIFPGISTDELKAAKESQGEKLKPSTEVEFVLFLMTNTNICSAMEQAVEEVMPDYAPAALRKVDSEDMATCSEFGIISFPTLDIVHEGSTIRRLVGQYPAVHIRQELTDLFDLSSN